MRLIRCLHMYYLYMALLIILGKVYHFYFDVLTGDQELMQRSIYGYTYRPEIDQSQHVKSVSHIISQVIDCVKLHDVLYICLYTDQVE